MRLHNEIIMIQLHNDNRNDSGIVIGIQPSPVGILNLY